MFSIIIPVYNAERYLRQALDSVVAQTYGGWECICVDDGSTDNSGAILDEYAARHTGVDAYSSAVGGTAVFKGRFKVIHQANGGEGRARNTGLAAAEGQWVTWLDADDLYASTRLEEVYRIIVKENPDMVRTRRKDGTLPDSSFFTLSGGQRYLVIDGFVETQKWGWNTLASGGMVWLWFVRRELLMGLLFRPELRVMTDVVFSINLIAHLKKVCQSDYAGYFYRDTIGSLIRGSRRAQDCVNHINACCDLWLNCKELAQKFGFLNEVLVQMRNAGEGVVVDWATHRDPGKESVDDILLVYKSFKRMKRLGALVGRRTIYRYYEIALRWWDWTGQIWLLVFTGWVMNRMNSLLRRA